MSQPVRDPQQQQPAAGHAPDGTGAVRALPFFHAHRRLALSALLAIALGAAFRAAGLSYSRAALLAFDVAALVFLLATARAHAGHAAIHARTRAAGRRGPQRGAVEQRGDFLPDRHGAVDGAALILGAAARWT